MLSCVGRLIGVDSEIGRGRPPAVIIAIAAIVSIVHPTGGEAIKKLPVCLPTALSCPTRNMYSAMLGTANIRKRGC